MTNSINLKLEKFQPKNNWKFIEKQDYAKYGIVSLSEAKVVFAYEVGTLNNKPNTVALYDYGVDDNFITELMASYYDLQSDISQQEEYGVFPMYWQRFNGENLLSVLKLISYPVMNIIDLFFVAEERIYAFHTYLPKNEQNFNLAYLMSKYDNIKYLVEKIDELKD